MFCSKCGKPIDETANFCSYCGTAIESGIINEKTEKEDSPNSMDNFIDRYYSEKKQEDRKSKIACIWGIIVFVLLACVFINMPNENATPNVNDNKVTNISQIKAKELYRNDKQGIYAYYIPKEQFVLKKFVNYSQSLPKGTDDNIFTFVFNENINLKELKNINKSIPLYTLNALWKNKPYFYFTHASNTQEIFCKLSPNTQEIYKRNLVRGDKLFNHVTTTHNKEVTALNACVYKEPPKQPSSQQSTPRNNIVRPIYTYNNIGSAGLATFAYNLTTSRPTEKYFYHYINGSPFRLEVLRVYSDYVIVSGNLYNSYYRPIRDLAIKTNRQYVNGELLADNTFYSYIGIINLLGRRMWAFEEVSVKPVN